MSNPNADLSAFDVEHPPAAPQDETPDLLGDLGPTAYGLFVLPEPGSLDDIAALAAAQAAQLPAQTERSSAPDARRLLGELGELDL